MDEYLRRATAALDAFDLALAEVIGAAGRLQPANALPKKTLDKLAEVLERVRTSTAPLRNSLTQMEATGLDIVDLQVRLEGEGAALASSLRAIGDLLDRTPAVESALGPQLQALEERAERVAAALFPNAIEGAADINRLLWEFRPLWLEYGHILKREVTRTGTNRLTSDELARIQETAEQVRARFDAVNDLLNELVVLGSGHSQDVRGLVKQARGELSRAVADARKRAADRYKPFHGVLKRAESLARKIDGEFADLRVPVFPAAERLEHLGPLVEASLYAELAGVERFALLNISARLTSIPCASGSGEHLLASRFDIHVFDVFPDRVYFTADRSFLAEIKALHDAGVFEEAPAALHRFNDGSFKQRQFRKGNLQISYAAGTPEAPGDSRRVSIDADIDLYRSPTRHLFGEVLVNHLTGSKTDQFRVWELLASTQTRPIGGFDVVTAT